MNKVMIGTVTYKGKDYCREEFVQRRLEMTHKDCIEEVWTDDIKGTSKDRIEKGYNLLLEKFLNSDCTHLLTLEADLIPPKHVIEYLLDKDKELVGALYMIGPIKNRYPCAYHEGVIRRRNYLGKELPPIFKHLNLSEIDGDIVKVNGCGLGCVLIRRELLEGYKFRTEDAHCDTYFHVDMRLKGIQPYVDTSIVCKHYGNWEEWTKIINSEDF
jgi:hypothetical protein